MSIANELSGEVAVAILSLKDKSPQELSRLKKIVGCVRAALEDWSEGIAVGDGLKLWRERAA